jgi:chromosome partitioning protein
MIYLFVNKKGGVGKSTLAAAFAVQLFDVGRKVAVLDADEQLHTARAIRQAEPGIHVIAQFQTNKIPETVQHLVSSFEDIVADAPAKLQDETRALMVMADVAIFPMEPTIKSLQSTRESIQVLEYARAITGGRPHTAWLVLNKAKTRTRIFREIESLAPKLGLRVAHAVIRDLQAFPEADQQGTVVTRMSPEQLSIRNAQADITALFNEIVNENHREVANA